MQHEQAATSGANAGDDERAPAGVEVDLAPVESTVCSFGRALGGDPTTIADLPFRERAADGELPEQVYVRHDDAMLGRVSRWLVGGEHIAVQSPAGTGKTALGRVIERDLGRRWDFVVATVDAPAAITERGLSEIVLRAAKRAGYTLDAEGYWEVTDGVPWLSAEIDDAIDEVTERVGADEATLLLLVDGLEALDATHDETLARLAEAGIQLCILGRPATAQRIDDLDSRLDSTLQRYETIAPFDQRAIAEYVARSLSWFRDDASDSTAASLFSGDAISYVLAETDGTPRAVRDACFELFVRAAVVWDRLDVDIERVTVTSALADRNLDPVLETLPRLE
ncbi:MAG: hypothetical protein ABEI77_00900 [Halorientalis sp.]